MPKEYKFFNSDESRQELVSSSKNLARYLYATDTHRILLVDRAARPAGMAVKYAWKKLFPNEKPPEIYFLNPEYLGNTRFPIQEVVNNFNHTYSGLASDKDAPILLYDCCVHRGTTFHNLLSVLINSGYENINLGASHPSGSFYSRDFSINLTTLNVVPRLGCHVFGYAHGVRKPSSSILSQASNWRFRRKRAIEMRNEMKIIIEESFEKK